MAGSGAAYSSSSSTNSTALSLVGALRRLGTRVNLVPVNFSSDSSRCVLVQHEYFIVYVLTLKMCFVSGSWRAKMINKIRKKLIHFIFSKWWMLSFVG
jgi:hypothetical protein